MIHTSCADIPPAIKECPVCRKAFNPYLRGMVKRRVPWYVANKKAKYALICERCGCICGWEAEHPILAKEKTIMECTASGLPVFSINMREVKGEKLISLVVPRKRIELPPSHFLIFLKGISFALRSKKAPEVNMGVSDKKKFEGEVEREVVRVVSDGTCPQCMNFIQKNEQVTMITFENGKKLMFCKSCVKVPYKEAALI